MHVTDVVHQLRLETWRIQTRFSTAWHASGRDCIVQEDEDEDVEEMENGTAEDASDEVTVTYHPIV